MDKAKRLAELTAEIDALLALAETETRDLSDEERETLATMETEADQLEAALKQQKADDDLRARNLARKNYLETPPTRNSTPPLEPTKHQAEPEFKLPAEAKRHGKLRYFKDEKDAYLSGLWYRSRFFGDKVALAKLEADHQDLAMTTVDSTGNIFIPDPALQTIIDLRESYGTARQKCNIQPMASDTLTIPRRLSGLTVYFVGETSAATESEPEWNQVKLTCRTLATLTRVSKELSEDATISIAEKISSEIAYAMAVKEDQCLFLGTAASTYGGITGLITACATATATVSTALTANTAYSTLDLADFEAMIGMLPEYPGIRPEWYIHKSGWAASMMRLADAAGGNTADVIEGKRQQTFLGYPVNFVNVMNSTLGAQADVNGLCYFGDLSMAATFGDRRGISVDSSTERYFEYRQVGIQGHERFDINVHDVGDASAAGPVIMLATPTS